jgi:hypothetical protein
MNDSLTLRLYQTATLLLGDETIHILYKKYILDSSSGVRAYEFLHALLKKAKRQLNYKIPTPPDIEKATSSGSFGATLECEYLQLYTMHVSFDGKTKSRFLLSALQQKCIEVDQFVDRLDIVPDTDTLPKQLTLVELILRIKYIHSFQNSSTAIINSYFRPTNKKQLSNTRQNPQSSLSDPRPNRPYSSDSHPTRDFRTHSDNQCIGGYWGQSVKKISTDENEFTYCKVFAERRQYGIP